LIGKATKCSQMLMNQPKRYEATMKLGATTATDDPDSPETPTPGASQPSLENIAAEAAKFVGTISQRPPAFSALKISGRPAYQLARRGQAVDLKARDIRIDAIKIISWQWPLLEMRIDCGRGTYVRAIARDLGDALKTGGYLTELRRTRIGPFDIDQAVTLERLEKEGIGPHLHPVSLADAENSEQGRQDDQHQG